MVMDIMEKTIRKEVIIGNAHLLDLEVLVPDRPARLLALGNLARNRAPAEDNPWVESLSAINYLVVGAGGDIYQLMEAVSKIKEKNPSLKVILADSLETPIFPSGPNNKPLGVERIIQVSKKMADASRAFLHQKAGILTGHVAGLACGVAFSLADKIEIETTVAFTITNFDLSLLEQLQQ
eukprot:TRINITY_DN6781_c0_g1_i1.p1 TRINITY_DN6781_c0_g1~~TRINITY_DN6781_c0_g1_i1.p1  ORF type:complete len:180 (+),score=53.99 TRINITY_DN6781_c0_g1_i1:330-869(+)